MIYYNGGDGGAHSDANEVQEGVLAGSNEGVAEVVLKQFSEALNCGVQDCEVFCVFRRVQATSNATCDAVQYCGCIFEPVATRLARMTGKSIA